MVTLTDSAASKIKEFMAEDPGEAAVLRVAVEGGGCSGFQYALGFDRGPKEGDNEIEMHGTSAATGTSALSLVSDPSRSS